VSKELVSRILYDLGLEINYYDLGILITKIFVITVVAFILGLNRELKQKPVGVKTLVIIGLTSCILTIISIESAEKYMSLSSSGAIPDPMRLPAQIVSGVGFLGAGVIFVRRNRVVSGLTTAAMIWGVANLGIAVGAGHMWSVIFAMILILFVLEGSKFLLDKFGLVKKKKVFLNIKFNSDDYLTDTLSQIKKKGMHIKDVSIKMEENIYKLEVVADIAEEEYITEIYTFLNKQEGVIAVEVKH
jgi:putative Mg2+ transporter-C (MgtC) family protein